MGNKENALALKLKYPKDYVSFSRGFTSSHRGVDMAWNSNYGGKHANVFAPADGTVVAVVNSMGNTYGQNNSWGNLVKINHGNNIYTLMAHMLKGSIVVSVGQKVTRGQYLGQQNNSGNSQGDHVHLELYLGSAATSARVDPVPYFYVYPDQVVNAWTKDNYKLNYYTPVKIIGNPVERDSKVNQLKVITDTLRARTSPSLNGTVLGYVKQGIYNVEDIRQADGYVWYNCGEFWCANNAAETWCNYLPKTIPHYDMVLLKLEEEQVKHIEDWCKAESVEYTVTEV